MISFITLWQKYKIIYILECLSNNLNIVRFYSDVFLEKSTDNVNIIFLFNPEMFQAWELVAMNLNVNVLWFQRYI